MKRIVSGSSKRSRSMAGFGPPPPPPPPNRRPQVKYVPRINRLRDWIIFLILLLDAGADVRMVSNYVWYIYRVRLTSDEVMDIYYTFRRSFRRFP